MNPAVLARGNIKPDTFFVLHHDAIGSQVHPFFVRILRNVIAACSDVTSAVELVPLRRRKREHVDIIPHPDIFQDRSIINELVRNRLGFLKRFGESF